MREARFAALLGFVFLAACGGGGGGVSTPPTTPPTGSNSVTLSGYAQKGPFRSGSNIDVSSLTSAGAIGGPLTSTTTSNILGRFQATINENQLTFVEASGRFLDESNGSVSSSTLRLSAVIQVGTAATQSANVNLLTHLATPRIRALLQGGATFSAAESQARDDVLAALTNIVTPPAVTSFKTTSLFSASQGDVDSAYLVILSALFTERAHQLAASSGADPYDELQALLNAVADDLGDGVVDFPDTLSLIRDASYHVNPDLVTASLSTAATTVGSSDFAGDINLFLDSDLDGEPNVDDADDDGDGVADASDAYPLDWACHLAVHGDGSSCDVESLMRANYTGRHFDIDSRGVVYMLDIDGQQVLRWSAPRQAFGMPVDVPFGGRTLAYSPVHDRIYVSFAGGQVLAIDPNDEPATTLFATLPNSVETIIPAGNFVIFARGSRQWHVVASDGSELDQREMGNRVHGAAWDDSTESLHYTLDLADITLETIGVDQTTGLLGTPQVSPIGNEFELEGLLHLSADGSRLATGTGDIFDTATLNWQYSIPGLYRGAAWLDDGTIAGLHWIVSNGGTRLQRRDDRGDLLEYAEYPGFPQRVLNHDGRLLVFTRTEKTNIHVFVPGGDIDRDGVANTSDDFPSDPAASSDTDRDGYPDNWNPGSSASDSTTGLELDPYPLDSACFLPQHGDGTTCNIGSALGFVDPFTVITDTNGVVYFWELKTQRITRWDSTNGHQNPLQFGEFSDDLLVSLKYSPEQHRLYLAYQGRISYFDLADPTEEIYLASTPTGVQEMQPAGNYVWATGTYGQFPGRYNVTFTANGDVADLSVADNLFPDLVEWDAIRARVYHLYESGFSSTARLWYHTVDQATGQIGAVIDSPDAPNYECKGPIRPSPDGNKILLGSGSIYNAADLTWSDMVTPGFADVQWDDNNSVVTIRRSAVLTVLARLRLDGTVLETTRVRGTPVAIRRDNDDFRFIVIDQGITFYRYTPSNDSDGDGVDNELDAFPLDPAASIDTDWDGRPDEWHPGMSELDSTTGLVLDSYPNDSACYLPEHGDGTVCDIAASIPDYIPEDIAIDDAGVVYLFSWWERRIYRWDSVTQEHLNPYVLGNDRWFGDVIPGQIAYHPTHDRLYIGYSTGELKYIEPDAGPREQYFASTAGGIINLGSAGDYLLVVDRPVNRFTHLVFDAAGVLTDVDDFFNANSPDYTWDPVRERMYFFDEGQRTGTDVVYETIDQSTGAMTGRGYAGTIFGDFEVRAPIRVSNDGNRIITGAGDIFDWQYLDWTSSFPNAFADGRWLSDGGIVAVRDSNGDTVYERRDNTYSIVETANFTGAPLAILPLGTDFLIITDQGSPAFQQHTPTGP